MPPKSRAKRRRARSPGSKLVDTCSQVGGEALIPTDKDPTPGLLDRDEEEDEEEKPRPVLGIDGAKGGWAVCLWYGPRTPFRCSHLTSLDLVPEYLRSQGVGTRALTRKKRSRGPSGSTSQKEEEEEEEDKKEKEEDGVVSVVVVGIDMPIGLYRFSRKGGRRCDSAARSKLGKRSSCVFSPPSRLALEVFKRGGDHNQVSRVNKFGLSSSSSSSSFSMKEEEMERKDKGIKVLMMGEEDGVGGGGDDDEEEDGESKRQEQGVGLSIQAFNILDKIVEVEEIKRVWSRPASSCKVGEEAGGESVATTTLKAYEVHPELSFLHLSGLWDVPGSSLPPKKTKQGVEKRLRLLETLGELNLPDSKAIREDCIDACAAAYSAWRISTGRALRLPEEREEGEEGEVNACIWV
ncbi:hypothetical protein IE53DRAFT_366544 [Violaceomyces palustris]|uniref:Uncharacterized protein n=1 Tax=Violaceomyces palustris TaxID=1673888 RepID=A0ACD0P5D5_9BASI|nr:hypothetical protein IE53DRAFT_366544 [Violaceomyces palustris]